MIYWIVVLGGGADRGQRLSPDVPVLRDRHRRHADRAQIVHGVVAVLFVAAMLGHIYIGTIGMEGAFEAMGSGTVDVNWAKEHHSLWDGSTEVAKGHAAPPAAGRHACRPAE